MYILPSLTRECCPTFWWDSADAKEGKLEHLLCFIRSYASSRPASGDACGSTQWHRHLTGRSLPSSAFSKSTRCLPASFSGTFSSWKKRDIFDGSILKQDHSEAADSQRNELACPTQYACAMRKTANGKRNQGLLLTSASSSAPVASYFDQHIDQAKICSDLQS